MSESKPFLTITEQVDLIIKKGLLLSNEDKLILEKFLSKNSYYRFSGYFLTFKENNMFKKNITINHLIHTYYADRAIRNVMLSFIEHVETTIKTLIANHHSSAFGPTGYLSENSLNLLTENNLTSYNKIMAKAQKQIRDNLKHELFIQHHVYNKNGIFPLWALVELLTITDISMFYRVLDDTIKLKVSTDLGYPSFRSAQIISTSLHCISILRNICAHGGRLYNRTFIIKPKLEKKYLIMLRKNNNDHYINNRLFSNILIIKSLIPPEEFESLKSKVISISNHYPLVDFKYYGFPDDWKIKL